MSYCEGGHAVSITGSRVWVVFFFKAGGESHREDWKKEGFGEKDAILKTKEAIEEQWEGGGSKRIAVNILNDQSCPLSTLKSHFKLTASNVPILAYNFLRFLQHEGRHRSPHHLVCSC